MAKIKLQAYQDSKLLPQMRTVSFGGSTYWSVGNVLNILGGGGGGVSTKD